MVPRSTTATTTYTLTELSAHTQTPTCLLRYYESLHLFHAVTDSTATSRYDQQALCAVRLIQHAQRLGFHLDEIRQICLSWQIGSNVAPLLLALMQHKLVEIDQQMQQLDLRRQGVLDCLQRLQAYRSEHRQQLDDWQWLVEQPTAAWCSSLPSG